MIPNLATAGAANIASKLIVQFDPATYFSIGSTLNVLQALGGVQGTFSQLEFIGVPAGSQWSVGYGDRRHAVENRKFV